MPKTRSRKNARPAQKRSASAAKNSSSALQPPPAPARPANRAFFSPAVGGPQSLLFPAMVALGCWGLAFTFAFYYPDPNHYLYGGMAALMALLWTFSVGVRVRKLALRQRASVRPRS